MTAILIADDDPDIRDLVACKPERAGHDVIAVAAPPTILPTARAREGDVEVDFDDGADGYVVEPFSPRELVSRVEAVLARMRA